MIPTFKYHPNPIETGAFIKGDAQECNCCGKQTDIWYESPFYSREEVDCLCPECIASGLAQRNSMVNSRTHIVLMKYPIPQSLRS